MGDKMNDQRLKEGTDLEGTDLVDAMRSDEQFVAESQEGFQQLDAGDNTVITLSELRESIKNGEPIL